MTSRRRQSRRDVTNVELTDNAWGDQSVRATGNGPGMMPMDRIWIRHPVSGKFVRMIVVMVDSNYGWQAEDAKSFVRRRSVSGAGTS